MRKTRRTAQVGEVVRDALVQIFRREIKDIDLSLVSITGVEVSPDLHFARVFISGLNDADTEEKVRHLGKAQGRIRHLLGQRIRLRFTPELDFRVDATAASAGRIETLLAEVLPKPVVADANENPEIESDETDDAN